MLRRFASPTWATPRRPCASVACGCRRPSPGARGPVRGRRPGLGRIPVHAPRPGPGVGVPQPRDAGGARGRPARPPGPRAGPARPDPAGADRSTLLRADGSRRGAHRLPAVMPLVLHDPTASRLLAAAIVAMLVGEMTLPKTDLSDEGPSGRHGTVAANSAAHTEGLGSVDSRQWTAWVVGRRKPPVST